MKNKAPRGARANSPEFSEDAERIAHFKRLRESRRAIERPRRRPEKQMRMKLRTPVVVEVIQMADMPRFHYDVWCRFDDGDSEPLLGCTAAGEAPPVRPEIVTPEDQFKGSEVVWWYVFGLANAVRLAQDRWGPDVRIELERWRGSPHRAHLCLSPVPQRA